MYLGRVAGPSGFSLTDLGVRVSRHPAIAEIDPASYPRPRTDASCACSWLAEACRHCLGPQPAHAPAVLAPPSQTTQVSPTHFAIGAVQRCIIERLAIVAIMPAQNGGEPFMLLT